MRTAGVICIRARIYACRKHGKISTPLGAGLELLRPLSRPAVLSLDPPQPALGAQVCQRGKQAAPMPDRHRVERIFKAAPATAADLIASALNRENAAQLSVATSKR